MILDILDLKSEDNVVIHLSSLSYFPTEYYAENRFESYIYDPFDDVPFYTGKVLIPEEAYINSLTEIEKYDKVMAIELIVPFDDSEPTLPDFETAYFQCEEYQYGQNLFLRIFAKDGEACNLHPNIQ
jgi:hypothetical protein